MNSNSHCRLADGRAYVQPTFICSDIPFFDKLVPFRLRFSPRELENFAFLLAHF